MQNNEDFLKLVNKYKEEMQGYRKKNVFYSGNESSCGSSTGAVNTAIPTIKDSFINAVPPLSINEPEPLREFNSNDDNIYKTESDYPVRESEEWETDSAVIKVYAYTARQGLPVPDADVTITRTFEGRNVLYIFDKTGISGESKELKVPAPPKEFSQVQGNEHPYANYNIRVDAKGYYTVENINVPVFGGETSIQPVEMIPLPENELFIRQKLVYEIEPADL